MCFIDFAVSQSPAGVHVSLCMASNFGFACCLSQSQNVLSQAASAVTSDELSVSRL